MIKIRDSHFLTFVSRCLLFLFIVAHMILSSNIVLALSVDQQNIFTQGINFFDVSGACSDSGDTSTTSTTSTPSAINASAAEAAAKSASTGGTNVGLAVYDTSGNEVASFNDTNENYGASITKSMVLVAYLKQVGSGTLSAYATTNLTGMIEQSSDQDANNVFSLLSDPQTEIEAVAKQAGMTGFKYNDQADKVYYLGQSQITAKDFAMFFSKIDTMFPGSQKSFALNLLSNITPQAGLLQTGFSGTVYSKEGWKPEPGTVDDSARSGSPNPFGSEGAPYIVNQAAQFSLSGTTYGVAVTIGGTASKSSGETIAKNIGSALISSGGQSAQSQGSSCCSNASSGSPATTSGSSGSGFTLDDVKTFASEPVTSTWNISNATVEQWFLKQAGAQATIEKYGLNSSNIGQITSAVEAAHVSPVFFYLDTVNEGGGAGGFINHFASDVPGGGPANAKNDSQYIASESQTTADGPATGGDEPGDMPTLEAKNILDSLPKGSLGVYYIQATSAVTAELEELSGKTGDWDGNITHYGDPMSAMMQNIQTMGGDPLQGGSTISTASCTTGGLTGSGIQKGINFAIFIANDNGYGYDQPTRETGWEKYQSDPSCTTQCGSFDCSSFVSAILTEAGYFTTNPNFTTFDEASELEGVGFKQVATSATTDNNLQAGDILLAADHTEMYIGNDQNVGAHENENNGGSGGQVGDQTGNEISVTPFYDDDWIGVFRAPN